MNDDESLLNIEFNTHEWNLSIGFFSAGKKLSSVYIL